MNRHHWCSYFIGLFSFLYIHCGGGVILTVPDVTYVVTDSGSTLSLTWDEVKDAEGYIIYGNAVILDTVQTLSYVVEAPVALVEIKAYSGNEVGDPDQISCIPVTTYSLQIWGANDTASSHPSGLSFGSDGQAEAIMINDSLNYPAIDYIFEDRPSFTTEFEIFSPNSYTLPYNIENNMAAITDVSNYNSLCMAYASSACSTHAALDTDFVYSLFLDKDNNGWDAESDHFGKMQVLSITSDSVQHHAAVVTITYQPIAGLRWVVTQ